MLKNWAGSRSNQELNPLSSAMSDRYIIYIYVYIYIYLSFSVSDVTFDAMAGEYLRQKSLLPYLLCMNLEWVEMFCKLSHVNSRIPWQRNVWREEWVNLECKGLKEYTVRGTTTTTIHLFIYLLKAYSPINRSRSHQGFGHHKKLQHVLRPKQVKCLVPSQHTIQHVLRPKQAKFLV